MICHLGDVWWKPRTCSFVGWYTCLTPVTPLLLPWQLESGDYCQNRIKQVPFPKLPDVFSITGEMINFSEEATLTIEVSCLVMCDVTVCVCVCRDWRQQFVGGLIMREQCVTVQEYCMMSLNLDRSCVTPLSLSRRWGLSVTSLHCDCW